VIEPDSVRAHLLAALPSFERPLAMLLEDWPTELPGICLELAEFGRYIAGLLVEDQGDSAVDGMKALESLIVSGDREVREAATSCGLEALDSRAGEARPDPQQWGKHLPPAAKAFLQSLYSDPNRFG
jgi:hypothetical protein